MQQRNLNALLILCALLGSLSVGASAQVQLPKNPKAEDIVERAILFYGSRPVLQAIQKNGRLRANVKFHTTDGMREGKTFTQFIRKPKLADDLQDRWKHENVCQKINLITNKGSHFYR